MILRYYRGPVRGVPGVLMWVGLAMRRPELLEVVGLRRTAD